MDGRDDRTSQGEIARLCAVARQHAARGEDPQALAAWLDAWALLEEPKRACEGAEEILAGVAEILARRGRLSTAIAVLLGA
jgi:hypothetical protein